jgi:hypothetical protein
LTYLRSVAHVVLLELLVEVRERKWTGQRQFAMHIGWNRGVVARIEAGEQIPTYLETLDWVGGCGMSIDRFNRLYRDRVRRRRKIAGAARIKA